MPGYAITAATTSKSFLGNDKQNVNFANSGGFTGHQREWKWILIRQISPIVGANVNSIESIQSNLKNLVSISAVFPLNIFTYSYYYLPYYLYIIIFTMILITIFFSYISF